MHRGTIALALGAAGLLAGCSYSPEDPGLLVSTAPPGAVCIVAKAGQALATAGPTPAIARVDTAGGGLTVTCSRHGFADATVALPPAAASTFGGAAPTPHRVDIALLPLPPGAPR